MYAQSDLGYGIELFFLEVILGIPYCLVMCGQRPTLSPQVHNAHDLEHVMELGSKNRSVGATLMNVDSSRSHSIFSIDIEMMESGEDGREKLRAGRLNLVDLAGSERQSKTGSTGREGKRSERGREGEKVREW